MFCFSPMHWSSVPEWRLWGWSNYNNLKFVVLFPYLFEVGSKKASQECLKYMTLFFWVLVTVLSPFPAVLWIIIDSWLLDLHPGILLHPVFVNFVFIKSSSIILLWVCLIIGPQLIQIFLLWYFCDIKRKLPWRNGWSLDWHRKSTRWA